MIFKNIFKPKWQHKDPVVRAQALQQLNDTKILTEIAQRDVEAHVRRKALEKIASFAAWVNAMEKDSDQHLQKVAFEKVKQAILESGSNQLTCSEDEINTFLMTTRQTGLIEDVIRRSKDNVLRLKLLKKINKDALLIDLLYREKDKEIAEFCYRNALSELTESPKLLEKIANKAANEEVKQLAQEQVKALKDALEKPVELRKELTLLLSKLLALKDKNDYLQVQQLGEVLVGEWQAKLPDLVCLPEEEQTEFKYKYQSICDRLESSTAKLKEAYLIEKEKVEAIEKRKLLIEKTERNIKELDAKVSEAISHSGDSEQSELLAQIESCKSDLEASHESGRDIERLFKQLNQYERNVQNLDEFTEQVAQATRSLTQLSKKEIPSTIEEYDQVQTYYKDWIFQWNKLSRILLFPLPDSLAESAQSLISDWKHAIAEFENEQNKKTKRLFAKLRELKSLIRSGKYNSAFGLYRKISEWVEELSESNQAKLEHELAQVNEQMADLEDWKAYVGLPRKQELVEEIRAIVEQPMSDLQAQANKIKFARKTWLLLGNVESEENTRLNETFDQLTEVAFAPCREFYAELEQQRAQNLIEKQALIEILSQIQQQPEETLDLNELGKQLFQYQNQWNKIGPVDKKIYKAVNQSFYDLIEPLKNRVSQYHKDNAAAKSDLIKQAEFQVKNTEDLKALTETLKGLQQKWKQVGFAGKHKEPKLWNQFRAINDAVFNQKQAQYQAEKEKRSFEYDKQAKLLTDIEQRISVSGVDLEKVRDELINIELTDLSKGQFDKLNKWQNRLITELDKLKQRASEDKRLQSYQLLFDALTDSLNSESVILPQDKRVLSMWGKSIELGSQCDAMENEQAQRELTIKIEIAQNKETPAIDNDTRMQLQVKMLSDKMNQGEVVSPDQLLAQWIECGLINLPESLLNRVKACF